MNRLRDNPIIADLESRSFLHPHWLAEAGISAPTVQDAIKKVFGKCYFDIVDGVPETDEEDDYDLVWEGDQNAVQVFGGLGWDVTDQHGKPLRMLPHLAIPLMAAIRSECGAHLPGMAPAKVEDWASALEKDARAFRGRK